MKSILYYFRAVSGEEIPRIHHGTLAELQGMFMGSVTPIIRTQDIDTEALRQEKLELFKEQLKTTQKAKTGLIHDLEWVISELTILNVKC